MDGITVGEHVADVIVSSPRYADAAGPDPVDVPARPWPRATSAAGCPQIALKRRTLPWERDPGRAAALGAHDPPRPWLALVVIAEGEGRAVVRPGTGRRSA